MLKKKKKKATPLKKNEELNHFKLIIHRFEDLKEI